MKPLNRLNNISLHLAGLPPPRSNPLLSLHTEADLPPPSSVFRQQS